MGKIKHLSEKELKEHIQEAINASRPPSNEEIQKEKTKLLNQQKRSHEVILCQKAVEAFVVNNLQDYKFSLKEAFWGITLEVKMGNNNISFHFTPKDYLQDLPFIKQYLEELNAAISKLHCYTYLNNKFN